MRRRAFLQLLGLAGVAASVHPSGIRVEDWSPGKTLAPSLPPEVQAEVLDVKETWLWCRYGGIDLAPWLMGLSLTREPIEVTDVGDVTTRFMPSANATIELDLILPDQDTRAALHEIWLGAANAVLEFGDSRRGFAYRVNAYTREIWADSNPEITRMGLRLLPTGMVTAQ